MAWASSLYGSRLMTCIKWKWIIFDTYIYINPKQLISLLLPTTSPFLTKEHIKKQNRKKKQRYLLHSAYLKKNVGINKQETVGVNADNDTRWTHLLWCFLFGDYYYLFIFLKITIIIIYTSLLSRFNEINSFLLSIFIWNCLAWFTSLVGEDNKFYLQ